MNDMAASSATPTKRTPTDWQGQAMQQRIRRRYAAERRFRFIGLGAILLSAAFLGLPADHHARQRHPRLHPDEVRLDVDFPKSALFLDPATLKASAQKPPWQRRHRRSGSHGGSSPIWRGGRRDAVRQRLAAGSGCDQRRPLRPQPENDGLAPRFLGARHCRQERSGARSGAAPFAFSKPRMQ
jgi:hypothetical protein